MGVRAPEMVWKQWHMQIQSQGEVTELGTRTESPSEGHAVPLEETGTYVGVRKPNTAIGHNAMTFLPILRSYNSLNLNTKGIKMINSSW